MKKMIVGLVLVCTILCASAGEYGGASTSDYTDDAPIILDAAALQMAGDVIDNAVGGALQDLTGDLVVPRELLNDDTWLVGAEQFLNTTNSTLNQTINLTA